jgi:hypothetical protein
MRTRSLARDRRARLRLIRHYVEMLAAMASDGVLGSPRSFAYHSGWSEPVQRLSRPQHDRHAIGMVAWMHSRPGWTPPGNGGADLRSGPAPLLAAGQVSLAPRWPVTC